MLNLTEPLKLLADEELKRLHQGSLKLLSETGMKIMVPGFLKALEAKGAKVDHVNKIVKFSPDLIEETLEKARDEKGAVGQMPFSWHNNFTLADRPSKVVASFGGAAVSDGDGASVEGGIFEGSWKQCTQLFEMAASN